MSERDEFEAWAKREGYGDQLGEFRELDTFAMDYAWKGFQAARAPQAVPALTEPIYQWRGKSIDNWTDCAKETYDNIGLTLERYPADQPTPTWERRIVYAAPQPSPEALTECAEIDPEAWKSLKAHAHDWRFSLQDHLYKCDCGATRGDFPFGPATFKD